MRILIDGRPLARGWGGVPRYTYNLIQALNSAPRRHEYNVLSWRGEYTKVGMLSPLPVASSPLPGRILVWGADRERWGLPGIGLRHPHLFHGTDFQTLRFGRAATVTTIHDVAYLRVPHCYAPGASERFDATVRRSIRTADHLLTDSAHARADLLDAYTLDPDRVSVVYPAVCTSDSMMIPQKNDGEFTAPTLPFGSESFLLHVGAIDARKNLANLIDGFVQATVEDDFQLVLAGPDGADPTYVRAIRSLVKAHLCQGRVHLLGPVGQARIHDLYTRCAAVATLGLYEGFGLPAVEAMLHSRPIVAARAGALPEIVGDAAVLVDPRDPADIAQGIKKVMTDATTRTRLIAAGPARARLFSPERMAVELEAIYESQL